MTLFTPSILNAAAALRGGLYPAKGLVKSCLRVYKEKIKMLTLLPIAGTLRAGPTSERPEPCEGKLSGTVLMGAWAG